MAINQDIAEWLATIEFNDIEVMLFEHLTHLLKQQQYCVDEYSLVKYLDAAGIFAKLTIKETTLGLFVKHFTIRRCLYQQQMSFEKIGFRLKCDLMRFTLQPLPATATQSPALITDRSSEALLAEFYGDINTLLNANSDGINKLIAEFWIQYEAYSRADEAYDILGIPKASSWQVVQQAYRKLAAKYHPDRGGDAALFIQVTTAYDRLKILLNVSHLTL
jgi:hypothetical protein